MMIAVCDMGPLHYLILIECDHILPRIVDRVFTARVVAAVKLDLQLIQREGVILRMPEISISR